MRAHLTSLTSFERASEWLEIHIGEEYGRRSPVDEQLKRLVPFSSAERV
jgi:hypothetical protein